MNKEASKRIGEENASCLVVKKFKHDIEITAECGICKQTLKDARMLPCCHFYCLSCFTTYSRNPRNCANGLDIRCPECKRSCNIPFGGVEKFPSGQFFVNLANFYKPKDKISDKCCSPCLAIDRNKVAAGHCVECQEDLCKSCLKRHGAMKATKSHKTVENAKSESEELPKNDLNFCQDHPDKIMQFYCRDCKKISCTECITVEHKEHNCSDINEFASEFCQVLDREYEMLKEMVPEKETAMKYVVDSQSNFLEGTDKIRNEIKKKYEDMKLKLEKQFGLLSINLDTWDMSHDDDFDMLREDIELGLGAINRFEVYWSEVKKCGSPCDIIEAASSLQDAADDLRIEHEIQQDRYEHVARPGYCKISYTPCLSDLDAGESVLGTLKRVINGREVTIRDGYTHVFDTFVSSGDEDAGEPLEVEVDTDEKED